MEIGFHDQVAVMGFSAGGAVALHTALAYPEHISHLILVGTHAAWDYNIVHRLGEIQVPALVIVGRDDFITPVTCGAGDLRREWSHAVHRGAGAVPDHRRGVVDRMIQGRT